MNYQYKGRELTVKCAIVHDVVPYLGGITDKEFFLDAEKCAEWKLTKEVVERFIEEERQ